MSRGLGERQRQILDVLATAGQGLSTSELRQRLGSPDRRNTQRSVRALIRRGSVREEPDGSRIRLTFLGALRLTPPPSKKPVDEGLSGIRELYKQDLADLRELGDQERAVHAAREKDRGARIRVPLRQRHWGPVQQQILAVLWRLSDPLEQGLPVRALKGIIGGDRSNLRRAIRSLIERGEIEESECGRGIRVSPEAALHLSIVGRLLPPIPEEKGARELLRQFT